MNKFWFFECFLLAHPLFSCVHLFCYEMQYKEPDGWFCVYSELKDCGEGGWKDNV